jgi:phosphonate transport system permease protein
MKPLTYANSTMAFIGAALVCLFVADIEISALNPGAELARLLGGIVRPDILSIEIWSVVWTVAFAVLGVGMGAVCGLGLALVYPRSAAVRALAVVLRSIHELFWALLLIQVFGLGPVTGVLAVGLPYTGYFAKVYSEIIEEADLAAIRVLPAGTSIISAFAFARLPELVQQFKTYTLYRLECGMRSTLVLGFVGLPTIGFHLEIYFKQGQYSQAAALLAIFYMLIGTRRLWARPWTLPFLIIASLAVLPASVGGGSTVENLLRFLTVDIVPAPLRGADLMAPATWAAFGDWLQPLLLNQALPGMIDTLILGQIALVGAAILSLMAFPLVSRRFAGRFGQPAGRVLLVIVRSTPEYMMAYVLLQIIGPSMLPAIIALAVHNGGIVGYLMGRHADQLELRADAPTGIELYAFESMPRLYGQFMAYMLYRWEIIIRESAIFGILGVTTLGYYVDAAISELRLDAAVVLIGVTVLMTIAIDLLSRRLRAALRIGALQTRLSTQTAPGNSAHQLS